MIFDNISYSMLIVSSSEKFNDSLRSLFAEDDFEPLCFAGSIAAAKRSLLDHDFDLVLVNSPLPDDQGSRFAMDISNGKYNTVCLFLSRAETLDSLRPKLTDSGVFCIAKPLSSSDLKNAVTWLKAARERLRKFEKKSATLEEKMEEIRIVNRAKWLLIDRLSMTEPEAHRFIEKQAMDRCMSKRQVAEDLIATYGK